MGRKALVTHGQKGTLFYRMGRKALITHGQKGINNPWAERQ